MLIYQEGIHQQQCLCGFNVPKYVPHQCPCPQGEQQSNPSSLGKSKISRYVWPQNLIISLLLSWVLGHVRFLCMPLKSEISISPSPVELLKLSPTGLQGQRLWGLIFLLCIPLDWESDGGSGFSLLWENLCNILQCMSHPPGRYGV